MPYITPVNNSIFVRCSNEGLDWTSSRSIKIIISDKEQTVTYDLSPNSKELYEFLSYFTLICLTQDIVLGWNLKPIFSALAFHSKRPLEYENVNFYDLAVMSDYALLDVKTPDNYREAASIMRMLVKSEQWENNKKVYIYTYKQLISKTIPSIETTGIVNKTNKCLDYCFYDLQNLQVNGRLRCAKVYKNSFNPHGVFGEEDCEKYIPRYFDNEFIYFDYKHMEVSFLGWLSKDKNFNMILDSGEDFYEGAWKLLLATKKCDKSDRKKCKDFFLPVFYGMGPKTLSDRLSISVETSQELIKRIKNKFSGAWEWLDNLQSKNNEFIIDYFGRKRRFTEEERYKVRNFSIQSPASVFCLQKLNEIDKVMKKVNGNIVMSIHDGYVIMCPRREHDRAIDVISGVMTKEEEMFSGLKMKVSFLYGKNFKELKG